MVTSTIEKFLPQTAGYINWVKLHEGESRSGLHRQVVEQNCINTSPCISEKTKEQLSDYDAQQLAYIRGLDNNPDCAFIINESVFDDYAQIVDIFGQGCNYVTKRGVEGFQVDFDIISFRHGVKREFHLVYQSVERTDNLLSYSGFEMTTAALYGCDADESEQLDRFMGYQENIFDYFEDRAVSLCKKFFVNNED